MTDLREDGRREPQQFRKKPVVIEAIQLTDEADWEEIAQWATAELHNTTHGVPGADQETVFRIRTLEGVMTAGIGDWIIKGVKGEFYPCKPDIFAATYESAALDPLEDGRQEFEHWAEGKVTVPGGQHPAFETFMAGWTARAARERELRQIVTDLRAHKMQGPSNVTGPVSEALNHVADRIEAALSETQPEPQEKV